MQKAPRIRQMSRCIGQDTRAGLPVKKFQGCSPRCPPNNLTTPAVGDRTPSSRWEKVVEENERNYFILCTRVRTSSPSVRTRPKRRDAAGTEQFLFCMALRRNQPQQLLDYGIGKTQGAARFLGRPMESAQSATRATFATRMTRGQAKMKLRTRTGPPLPASLSRGGAGIQSNRQ